MSFLTRRRLVTAGLTGREPILFIYDAIALVFFGGGAALGFLDLRKFDHGAPVILVAAWSFAFIGSLGFYSPRLAILIALARGNRMPQPVEWIVFLGGVFGALVLLITTGPAVRAYGRAHGYRFCSSTGAAPSDYTFAREGQSCPPPALPKPRG